MGKKYKSFKKPVRIGDEKPEVKEKDDNIQSVVSKIEKQGEDAVDDISISVNLDDNYKKIQGIFKDCFDMVIREFAMGSEQRKCFIVYIDGMINASTVNENLLKALMTDMRITGTEKEVNQANLLTAIKNSSISIGDVKEVQTMKDTVKGILAGSSVLFIDKAGSALTVSTKGWEARKVTTAEIEPNIRGPQEGFVEDLKVNTALIRRRIKTPDLKMEKFELGRSSKTDVIVAYIKGIADDGVLTEVRKRIKRIDVDTIIESGQLEHLIEDAPFSPFPQIELSEKPDRCAQAITDGRVVIIIDGTPFVIIVPTVFFHVLSVNEDNYVRMYFGIFIKTIRYAAFAIALLGPSFYIAITTYHQEMIPISLLITLASTRAEVPFPAIAEAILMETTFELIREASERLPRYIGLAVSIVGVLVIGQTAIQTGLVSPAMVIVVSLTAVASFTIPKFSISRSVRILRFPIMVLAATLGIFGIVMGILVLVIHAASLRSFGVPYLSPAAPLRLKDWKNTIFRMPAWIAQERPAFIQKNNKVRAKKGLMPKPPKKDED